MRTLIVFSLIALAACAHQPTAADSTPAPQRDTQELTARRATRDQIALEKQRMKRFNVCMKQVLGPFSGFASPDSRRKAAETCNASDGST